MQRLSLFVINFCFDMCKSAGVTAVGNIFRRIERGFLKKPLPIVRRVISSKEVVLSTSHHVTLETVIASVTRARKSEREII